MTETTTTRPPDTASRSTGTGWSFALSYVLAGVLLFALVWAGGLWNLLANSRILDLLMRSGVIAFTDADQGFYDGVPDAEYFVASQDPIDWGLLLLTVVLLLVAYVLRGLRFDALVRFAGASPPRALPLRAYLRGYAGGAFLPYGYGRRTIASELEASGWSSPAAWRALALTRFLTVLEIAVFTFAGLVTLAWSTALGQLVWPALILGVAYLLVRPSRDERSAAGRPLTAIGDAASTLAQEPPTLVRVSALSGIAFLLEVIAVYALSQAFSSTNVILNVDLPVVMMAVVAGHLASYVEVTPGGFGQFEWGMATALYIGGLGIPEAVTLPVLYAVVRYIIAGALYLVFRFTASPVAGAPRTATGVA